MAGMLAGTAASLKQRDLTGGRGVFAALAGLAGLAVMLWGATLAVREVHAIWRSSRAAGQIVKLVDRDNDARRAPVVAFVDERGGRHTFMAAQTSSAVRYAPGDGVVVLYDASDPSQARIGDFPAAFAPALLSASGGALLLLIAGLAGQRRTRARRGVADSAPREATRERTSAPVQRPALTRRSAEPELQFHPFNEVAVKHYLAGLGKPASARKVTITQSRQALAQGRIPVALVEFLSYACALAYHEEGARYLTTHCPRVAAPHLVRHGEAQALCFLFEGVIVIALADPEGAGPRAVAAALFSPKAGARQYVPEDTVWDAAPRARGTARAWAGLRDGVETWLKGVLPKGEDDEKPAILIAGHHRGGSIAMLAAYEFAKRGRNVACVVAFGAAPAGGRAFVRDYGELGLDEHTFQVVAPDQVFRSWRWPFAAPLPGLVFKLPKDDGAPEREAAPSLYQRLVQRIGLRLRSASRKGRRAILRHDIERHHALSVTTLIHGRLLDVFLADKSEDPAREAYVALCDHLLDSRGVRPQDASEVFATLNGLPAMRSIAPGDASPVTHEATASAVLSD